MILIRQRQQFAFLTPWRYVTSAERHNWVGEFDSQLAQDGGRLCSENYSMARTSSSCGRGSARSISLPTFGTESLEPQYYQS